MGSPSDDSPMKLSPGSIFVPILISLVGVFSASVALVVYHFVLVKLCLRWRLRAGGGVPQPSGQEVPLEPIGVDQKLLETIPIIAYSSAGDECADQHFFRKDQTECVVCLGELEHGEMVRLLPNCKHAFHVPCIDEWFVAHISCPICRSSIVEEDPPPALLENIVVPTSPPPSSGRTSGVGVVFSPDNRNTPWAGILITGNNDASSSDSGANKQAFATILSIGSAALPATQRALSSPRGIAGLRRSLSLDYSSVVINIQRDGRRDGSSPSSSSVITKDDPIDIRTTGTIPIKHLDRVSSKFRLSLSRLGGRNSDITLPY